METPSSTRRITRSQASATLNNIPMSRKKEENNVSRSRNGRIDRFAMIDITNDSPIVGLAAGSTKTPASMANIKARASFSQTPGSGESVLRGQVKSLLQKVEEEADQLKIPLENRPFAPLRTLLNSPATLLAPTPANTPQIPNPSIGDSDSSKLDFCLDHCSPANPVREDQEPIKITEAIVSSNPEAFDSQESLITRALLFDSPGKSELSDHSSISSAITCDDGDDSSEWSIEVNRSSHREGDDEEEGMIDELCEGFNAICVAEKQGLPRFSGKHTRFMYNSDDEIEGEEISDSCSSSPGVLHLKGIPTPRGKHLRFLDEGEEES